MLTTQDIIEWREWLDRKQRYLCNKARTLHSYRRKNMAIGTTTTEGPKGWVEGKLVGFKEGTGNLRGVFKLTTGDYASMFVNNPVKLSQINPLMLAFGLQPFETAGNITLPEDGDSDMMGMDVPISLNIVASGDFYNVKGFRAIDAESKPPF